MAASSQEKANTLPADSQDLLGDLLRASKGAMIAGLVFSFIVNMAILVMPFYMYNLFLRVLPTENFTTLYMLLMVVVWVLGASILVEHARTVLLGKVSQWIDRQIGERLFMISLEKSVPRGAGAETSLLAKLQSVRFFISSPQVFVAADAVWVPIFVAVLFAMNFQIGLTALFVVMTAVGLAVGKRIATDRVLADAGRAATKAQGLAGMAVRNAETIETLGMSNRVIEGWHRFNDRALELQAMASRRSGIFQALVKFVRMGSMAAIMTVAMMQIFSEDSRMAPGLMMASMLLVMRCVMPLEILVNSWDNLVESFRSIAFLRRALREGSSGWTEGVTPPDPTGHLGVRDLVYDPPEASRVILNRVAFQLQPGDSLAILGPTASGKSSLARMLVGIEAPTSGDVRLDGTVLHAWEETNRGLHIGYLPQHVQLLTGTVFENISRFSEGATEEEVWRAADCAGVRAVIEGLPNGLYTEVGLDGGFLSGGQKQRVGLARAVYGNVKLVVLDEPNAHLDAAGEQALHDALVVLKERGVTVIVILHRPNILSVVDYIMVMRDGGIQKFAPRDEMLPLIGIVPPKQVEHDPAAKPGPQPKRAETAT